MREVECECDMRAQPGCKALLTMAAQAVRMRLVPFLLLLAACNTSGPEFRGLAATQVTVAGSVFDVRVRGDRAEAIRVNAQYAPRIGPMHARAAFAIQRVSGCRVSRMSGDQAQATARLACGARPPGWQPPQRPVSYSCVEIRQWLHPAQEGLYAEFDCDPYTSD